MENTDDELTNDKTEEQEDDYQLIDPNDLTYSSNIFPMKIDTILNLIFISY